MVILGHPLAYLNPGEAKILPQPDAWQGHGIANLGSFAGLFKDPRLGDLEANSKLVWGEQVARFQSVGLGLHSCEFWCRVHATCWPLSL